jgi:N-methylhydantoinase B
MTPAGDSTASTATEDGVVRIDELAPGFRRDESWDGRRLSYIPVPKTGAVDAVRFHTDFDRDVDPVTREIIRWRLWNLNLEHGETIRRISGSYIIVYTSDYNTWILTEDGETVLGGPSIQYFVGMADLSVKWTLEHRSDNPGIEDGDAFIQNDPWVAAAHQMDTAVFAPFYWEGRIFSWLFSAAHMRDLGGTQAGSFCVDARDVYDEPTPWPPTKIVGRGRILNDVAELFARQSRSPESTMLQLRSQFAGLNAARIRMRALLEEYGPGVVKGAMRSMIRDTSAAVSERLLGLPDGEWSESTHFARRDGTLVPVRTTVRKEGDRLIVGNEGTGEQLGQSGNGAYHSFRSGALAAAGTLLAWDQLYTPGGVLNHLQFEPVPGTMTVATYPAAVTTVSAPLLSMTQAYHAMSKMVLTGSKDLAARANAMGTLSNNFVAQAHVVDEHGVWRFGGGDVMVGAMGAFADRDGVDTGGAWWWPRINGGNVEEIEAEVPTLYLYRREQADSGGAGRFRGGNALETSYIGHKAREYWFVGFGNDPAMNSTPGLSGGYPGRNTAVAAQNTPIRSVLRAGRMPGSRAALEAEVGPLTRLAIGQRVNVGTEGVVVVEWNSGGGYGDPLRRDPAAVVSDVVSGNVTSTRAASLYGVVVHDGALDEAATDAARAVLRQTRLVSARPPTVPAFGQLTAEDVDGAVLDGVAVGRLGGATVYACSECGQSLGEVTGNYRDAAALLETNPHELDAGLYDDPKASLQQSVVFRRWCCPSCAQQLVMECVPEGSPVTWDIRLSPERADNPEEA